VAPFRSHLRLAVSAGLISGVVFGSREAVLTLFHNAAVQPKTADEAALWEV